MRWFIVDISSLTSNKQAEKHWLFNGYIRKILIYTKNIEN